MKKELEHFRNLISLAAIDGKIEEIERITLSKIAYGRGISMERMNVMLKHADEYTYIIPQNLKDKGKQIKEMIDFALVDDDFAEAEKNLILSVGQKLGFSSQELNLMIESKLRLAKG